MQTLFRLARDSAISSGLPVTVVIDSVSELVWIDTPKRIQLGSQDLPEAEFSLFEEVDSIANLALLGGRRSWRLSIRARPLGLPDGVRMELPRARARFTFEPTGAALADTLLLTGAVRRPGGGHRRLDRRREGLLRCVQAVAGFVLLEAVVALAILGVASIALLQVRAQQIRVASQARELLTAQALAEDRISAIRLLDYELLADPPDSLLEGAFPVPFEAFSWTAEVALIEDEYDLFGVEVVVLGPVERFPLRTLMHRPRSVLVSGEGAFGGATAGAQGGRGEGGEREVGGEGGARGGEAGGARGGEAGGRGGADGRTRWGHSGRRDGMEGVEDDGGRGAGG